MKSTDGIRRKKSDADHEEVKGPDAQDPPDKKTAQVNGTGSNFFRKQDISNEEATQHEKEQYTYSTTFFKIIESAKAKMGICSRKTLKKAKKRNASNV